ncbi:glycosyltransferase [Flavobacterium sp.]|uniref:glycosyltransferase n=1 Tax=Flavobacterium sp. TaxID=239 RepID=UPI003526DE88
MRIIQVIDTLNVGGAEKVFVDMCNILFENNQDVAAFFLLESGVLSSEINSKIQKFQLHRENKWSIKKMKECSVLLNDFDIVHCHFRHVYRYITLVNKLFPINAKIILHDHYGSIDVDLKVPFLFSSFFKPKYYIGVSNTLVQWAKSNLQLKDKTVFLLENIIIKNQSKKEIKKNYDFILVSNIKKIKNNQFAIDLAKKMNRSLLLVGKNQDNNYFQNIEKSITDSIEIDSSISNAQQVLHCAKFGLHTSLSETGPLVLIEYIAHGLPFLAYETGEVSKVLKNYFPLFFIDNFDINQWEERIKKINENQIDYSKFENVFQKEFGMLNYYQKLVEIYICINPKN